MHRGLYSPRCNGASSRFSSFRFGFAAGVRGSALSGCALIRRLNLKVCYDFFRGFCRPGMRDRSRLHGTSGQPRYEAQGAIRPFPSGRRRQSQGSTPRRRRGVIALENCLAQALSTTSLQGRLGLCPRRGVSGETRRHHADACFA